MLWGRLYVVPEDPNLGYDLRKSKKHCANKNSSLSNILHASDPKDPNSGYDLRKSKKHCANKNSSSSNILLASDPNDPNLGYDLRKSKKHSANKNSSSSNILHASDPKDNFYISGSLQLYGISKLILNTSSLWTLVTQKMDTVVVIYMFIIAISQSNTETILQTHNRIAYIYGPIKIVIAGYFHG